MDTSTAFLADNPQAFKVYHQLVKSLINVEWEEAERSALRARGEM